MVIMGKKLNSLILATALTCLSTNFVSAEALDTNTQDQIDPINLKESVTEDGFRYVTNNDDTITIRAYEGKKTNILIPNEIDGKSVTKIDGMAFEKCKNLTEINIDDDNPQYSSEDGMLYNKDKTQLIRCPIAKKSVTIPDSVTEIESAAFKNCSSLTEIEIPKGVTAVRQEAFGDCSKLRKIKIAESVKDMGIAVFLNCNLTIYGEENSSAQTYANENKIAFKLSSEYDKDILPDDPISPETTTYTVKFLNDDGSQIGETQEVEEGKSAIARECKIVCVNFNKMI